MVARSITSSIARRQAEKKAKKEDDEDDVGLTPDAWRELAVEGEKVTFDNPLQHFVAEFRQGKVSPYKLARRLLLTQLVIPTHVENETSLMLFPTEYVHVYIRCWSTELTSLLQDCNARLQITVSLLLNWVLL